MENTYANMPILDESSQNNLISLNDTKVPANKTSHEESEANQNNPNMILDNNVIEQKQTFGKKHYFDRFSFDVYS